MLFGAAAALVAVVVAVVAVLVFTGGDEAPAGEPVVPTAYTPDFNGEGFQQIADRSADGREITEGEAAPAKELESGGHKFTLAKSDLTGDCKAATWGERLHGDLDKFGCTQLVRSAYVSSDKKYAGQFYVFNLKNEEGVKQILRDLAPETGAGWVEAAERAGRARLRIRVQRRLRQDLRPLRGDHRGGAAGGERPDSLNELIDVSLVVEGAADFLYGRLDLAANAGAGQ